MKEEIILERYGFVDRLEVKRTVVAVYIDHIRKTGEIPVLRARAINPPRKKKNAVCKIG